MTNTGEKAYFWGTYDKKGTPCSKKGNYYVKKYRFHAYKCTCYIDSVANKVCENNTKITDITESTGHYSDASSSDKTTKYNDNVAYIYYKDSGNGSTACSNGTNEFVDHVCSTDTATIAADGTGHHGYQWYSGRVKGSRGWSSFKRFGWYHSGGCYDYNSVEQTWANSDPAVDAVYQCNIACKRTTGEIDYKTSTGTECKSK